jgi:type IV pilus assembly protein PilM
VALCAIKALLAESGIKTRRCVSSVAGQSQVVVRVIDVPKMKPEELAETMKWEIERHVPFSPTEVEYDFQPLDRPGADPDAQEMEVLLAVAQQGLINSHIEALFAAGLQPMAIDIEPLAASRALIETSANGARGETVAIVDIGANCTDVGVFENGILTFPSPPIGIAGVNFTREIAEAMGQSLEEAETTKKEYAAVDLHALAAAPQPDVGFPRIESGATQHDTEFGPLAASDDDTFASAGAFTETVDGPVFDQPVGPAFDLGGDDVEIDAGQTIDIGSMDEALTPGPAFDLGGDETSEPAPSGMPDFDLEDAEPVQSPEESSDGPSFDLSDADAHADPGEAAVPSRGAPAAGHAAGSVQEQVFQAISGVLAELAEDLRRSVEYYSTKYSRMPARVFLCGGTAKIPKLDEYLSRELGVPVEVADPLKNVKTNVPAASPQYLKEISPLFSVSIGLAIRDMVG